MLCTSLLIARRELTRRGREGEDERVGVERGGKERGWEGGRREARKKRERERDRQAERRTEAWIDR